MSFGIVFAVLKNTYGPRFQFRTKLKDSRKPLDHMIQHYQNNVSFQNVKKRKSSLFLINSKYHHRSQVTIQWPNLDTLLIDF